MKKILIFMILTFSTQVSAERAAHNVSYQQTGQPGQNIAMMLLNNNSEGEITLLRRYRISSETDRLIVVSQVTHGFTPDGRYQRGYQYVCRQSRLHHKGLKLSASLCGELDYRWKLKRS